MRKIGLILLLVIFVSANTSAQLPKSKIQKTKISLPKIVKLEDEILKEINTLRENPQAYVKYLEEMRKSFRGTNFKNAAGVDVISIEGVKAVDEAITALKTQTPLPVLKMSEGLSKAANKHHQDMIQKDFFGHKGSDNSLPDDRAKLFGTALSGVNENLMEGSKSAREIVLQTLVDDGFASRNHRKNLLSPQFKLIGISAGETNKRSLCVLVFASSFVEGKGGAKQIKSF